MRRTEERAAEAYRERFGEGPEVVASAPGRVNLIGEHTNYNGGFALPCAIDRRVSVACGKAASDADALLHSTDFGDTVPLGRVREGDERRWADYPRGVVWALGESGREVGPFRAVFSGDVPQGAGLSSSAAIESATILALDALFGFGLDSERKEAALLCQRAENGYVGVRSGILDQYSSLLCKEGAALFIDCRSLEAGSVPMDLEAAGLTLLVCDTRISGGLGTNAYGERRASCERASKKLGVEMLRDASEEALGALDGEDLLRARHIVTENTRVMESVAALKEGNYARFGEMMYASHASMRDDFEISTPEHDACVELAKDLGAAGARLTGGGFRGCSVVLADAPDTGGLERATLELYERRGFRRPRFYGFSPAGGAEVL